MNISLKNLKRIILSLVGLTTLGLTNMGIAGAACTASVGCTSSASTVITVNVNPIIAISNTNSITLNVTPTAAGNISYAADVINVTTNDVTGFALSIYATNGTDNKLSNGTNVICPAPSAAGANTTSGSLSPLGTGAYNSACTTNTSGHWGFEVCKTTTPYGPIATGTTTGGNSGNFLNGTTTSPTGNCPVTSATATGSQNALLSSGTNNTWYAVPTSASPYTFYNISSSTNALTSFLVNYAVSANANQPSGNGTQGSSYSATVIYTATTN